MSIKCVFEKSKIGLNKKFYLVEWGKGQFVRIKVISAVKWTRLPGFKLRDKLVGNAADSRF